MEAKDLRREALYPAIGFWLNHPFKEAYYLSFLVFLVLIRVKAYL